MVCCAHTPAHVCHLFSVYSNRFQLRNGNRPNSLCPLWIDFRRMKSRYTSQPATQPFPIYRSRSIRYIWFIQIWHRTCCAHIRATNKWQNSNPGACRSVVAGMMCFGSCTSGTLVCFKYVSCILVRTSTWHSTHIAPFVAMVLHPPCVYGTVSVRGTNGRIQIGKLER